MADPKKQLTVREMTTALCEPHNAILIDRKIGFAMFEDAVRQALNRSQKLRECTPVSLRSSVRMAAMVGLLPNGEDCVLVPYKKMATCLVMANGMKRLIYESNQAQIRTGVIYEGDEWDMVETHSGSVRLKHKRLLGQKERPEVIGAYCEIKFPGDTEWVTTLLDQHEIERARTFSQARNEDAPWQVFYDRMAEKTAVLRGCRKERYRISSLGLLHYMREEDHLEKPTFEEDEDTITVHATNVTEEEQHQAGAADTTIGTEARPADRHANNGGDPTPTEAPAPRFKEEDF